MRLLQLAQNLVRSHRSRGLVSTCAGPRAPLAPVLQSQAGLATTTIIGASFKSIGALGAGVIGACYHVVSSKSKATVDDVRHTHGDEAAELAGTSLAATNNVVRASVLATSATPVHLAGNAAVGAGMSAAAETRGS